MEHNENAHPFERHKINVRNKKPENKYSNLCKWVLVVSRYPQKICTLALAQTS